MIISGIKRNEECSAKTSNRNNSGTENMLLRIEAEELKIGIFLINDIELMPEIRLMEPNKNIQFL